MLLCCVLPVKTPFLVLCYQSYDIFGHKAKYLWILILLILSHEWCIQKLLKYQVGIKWIMNEKLVWTPNSIYDVSWRVLKSSGPNEFVEILAVLSVEELMGPQLICSIVGHIWHAVWLILIRLEGPEDTHLRNSRFGGHVTLLTLHYLWPRPPGVWLGGPGCKPGHSEWS